MSVATARALAVFTWASVCAGAACSGGVETAHVPHAEEEVSSVEAPDDTAEGAPADPDRIELDPSEPLPAPCERALECCRAYVAAMPPGQLLETSACAGIPEAADAPEPSTRCQLLIDGWRQALEHLADAESPPACAP